MKLNISGLISQSGIGKHPDSRKFCGLIAPAAVEYRQRTEQERPYEPGMKEGVAGREFGPRESRPRRNEHDGGPQPFQRAEVPAP